MNQERRISRARYTFYIVIICCSVVICYLGFVRGMRFFAVPSDSMEPTLYRGDYLLTLNAGEYQRGEIVVMRDPVVDGATWSSGSSASEEIRSPFRRAHCLSTGNTRPNRTSRNPWYMRCFRP